MPHTIGHYQVTQELGRGGMGVVYRAHDPRLNREVAIKVLLAATRERQRARFMNEARSLARLRHPHIVEVFDVGLSAGYPFIVMDYVPGESLQRRLERQGPLDGRRAAQIVTKLARAVEYAHTSGVLHRDIKPDNVIVSADGEPRLTDFGLAKDLRDSSGVRLSTTGQFMGTPGFWPPEQAGGQVSEIDARSDVYALGATLYTLLCGRPPFVAATAWEGAQATLGTRPDPPSAHGAKVDPALEAIALRCLEKDKEARYATAGALAAALNETLRPARRPARTSRLAAVPIAIASVVVVLASVALLVILGRDDPGRGPPTVPPAQSTPGDLGASTQQPGSPSPETAARPDEAAQVAAMQEELERERRKARRAKALQLVERARLVTQVNTDYRGGIAHYDEAITLDPTFGAAWAGRGVNRYALEEYHRALDDLNRAVELDPEDASSHQYRAMTLLSLRRTAEAMTALNRAIELDPSRGDAFTWRGLAYLAQQRFELAAEDLARALRLVPPNDPSVPLIRQRLAQARQAMGR